MTIMMVTSPRGSRGHSLTSDDNFVSDLSFPLFAAVPDPAPMSCHKRKVGSWTKISQLMLPLDNTTSHLLMYPSSITGSL